MPGAQSSVLPRQPLLNYAFNVEDQPAGDAFDEECVEAFELFDDGSQQLSQSDCIQALRMLGLEASAQQLSGSPPHISLPDFCGLVIPVWQDRQIHCLFRRLENCNNKIAPGDLIQVAKEFGATFSRDETDCMLQYGEMDKDGFRELLLAAPPIEPAPECPQFPGAAPEGPQFRVRVQSGGRERKGQVSSQETVEAVMSRLGLGSAAVGLFFEDQDLGLDMTMAEVGVREGSHMVANELSLHCNEMHQLRRTGFDKGVYDGGWVCDSCSTKHQGERWCCPFCHYDICDDCTVSSRRGACGKLDARAWYLWVSLLQSIQAKEKRDREADRARRSQYIQQRQQGEQAMRLQYQQVCVISALFTVTDLSSTGGAAAVQSVAPDVQFEMEPNAQSR